VSALFIDRNTSATDHKHVVHKLLQLTGFESDSLREFTCCTLYSMLV